MTFSGAFPAQAQSGQHREVELYHWVDFPVEAPGAATGIGRWDVQGHCTWTHEQSGAERTSLVWYSGSGDTFIYRFGASYMGRWNCTARSPVDALDGLQLTVDVVSPGNPQRTGWSGQLTDDPAAWARQKGLDGRLVARTPVLIMMPHMQLLYDNPDEIQSFISEFNENHGFNGGHITTIGHGWFDAGSTASMGDAPATPDVRTFQALELAASEWSERGGWLHIWIWGKGQDFNDLPGGYKGDHSRRINRYIAARLGPVPGWSMGVGWDIEFWINETRLKWWLDDLIPQLGGWHHWIGHRYSDSDIGKGKDPDPINRGEYLPRGIKWNTLRPGNEQYAGWEHWRTLTSDEEIDAGFEAVSDRPMMSEDRFRRRDDSWRQKDLLSDREILEEIPRWAGRGVGAIYGRLINNSNDEGSEIWPNKAEIKSLIKSLDEDPAVN